MTPLASVQVVRDVWNHPNADKLDLATVLGYQVVVGRDQFKNGDLCVFVQPDSSVPADAEWAPLSIRETSKRRVRAIKLRGEWSMGLALNPKDCGIYRSDRFPMDVGTDVTEKLGVTKYEAPLPQGLDAIGHLPIWLPKTDEERWQNFEGLDEMLGCVIVDVSLKLDGTSYTCFYDHETDTVGFACRTLVLDPDGRMNVWKKVTADNDLLRKVREFGSKVGLSYAVRGEITGAGIQASGGNPDAIGETRLRIFSVFVKGRGYVDPNAYLGSYFFAQEFDLEHVPVLEKQVLLTRDLIEHYDSVVDKIDGLPFEGVVVRGKNFSFKIINKHYDSRK